jgi:putative hydrolase of the HAD superfamily
MPYKAVIFDLFGTLIDNYTVAEHKSVLGQVADALGAPRDGLAQLWEDTYYERATGAIPTLEAALEDICRQLQVDADEERMANAIAIRLGLTQRTLEPQDGALETLSQLRADGHKIGLISDCSEEIPRLWEQTPFAPLIDVPIFSSAAGMKKPDARIYHLACEGLEVEPQDCLYIGDGSSRELTGAAQVGMTPVLIRVPYEKTYEPHRIDVDEWEGAEISSLTEVLKLVE